jgi:hypothetical protein
MLRDDGCGIMFISVPYTNRYLQCNRKKGERQGKREKSMEK